MAVNVGDLEATIRLLDELSPQLKKVEKNVGGFSAKSSAMMGVFMGAGTAAFEAVSRAAIGMARDVPMALFKAASEAEESENLFRVSFGNMADAARKWSVELAAATGQNEFDLRKNAATLFTMMESMGVARDKAYEMATALTALSGDMASFYNLPHEDAFAKIQAGITGEAEPLKRLGIIVTQTTIEHAAMTHGLIKQGEAMDEQTKVQARYLAIMDQTVKAQGDLAATLHSPANAVRALSAQFEALKIHLGQALMPAFAAVIKILGKLLAVIMDNKESITEWIRFFVFAFSHAGDIMLEFAGMAVSGLNALRKKLVEVIGGAKVLYHTLVFLKRAKDNPFLIADAMKVLAIELKAVETNVNDSKEAIDGQNLAFGRLVASGLAANAEMRNTVAEVTAVSDAVRGAKDNTTEWVYEVDGVEQAMADLNSQLQRWQDVADWKKQKEEQAQFNAELDQQIARQQAMNKMLWDNYERYSKIADQMAAQGKSYEEIEKALAGVTLKEEDRAAIMERVKKSTEGAEEAGNSFGVDLKEGFQQALEDLPGVILGAIQGGGDVAGAIGAHIGGTVGSAISEHVSAGIASLGGKLAGSIGGMLGEGLGGMVGSIAGPLGSMAGKAIGGLVAKGITSLFSGPSPAMKAAAKAGEVLGAEVSEEMGQEILDKAEELGVSIADASLLYINEIAEETGKSLEDMGEQLSSLMEKVADGTIPAAEGVEELGEAFSTMREEAEAAGKWASKGMSDMIAQSRALGLDIPEVTAYVNEQLESAVEGLGMFVEALEYVSEDRMPALGEAAAEVFTGVFQALVSEHGLIGAVDMLGESFNQLRDTLWETLGPEAAAAILGPLGTIFDTVNNEQLRPLFEGIQGITQALIGMTNAGYMNVDMFNAMQTGSRELFDQLLEDGADMNVALAAIAPDIQAAIDAANRLGVPLNADMQYLKDLAEQNGYTFSTDPMDAMLQVLVAIAEVLGADIPAAAQQAANAMNNIPAPPSVPGGSPGAVPPHDRDGEPMQQGFYSPSMPRGRGQDGGTNIRVHEGEEVSVLPASLNGGGGGDQPLQVVVQIGNEKLYDMVTKATKTGQVRVYPDAVKSF